MMTVFNFKPSIITLPPGNGIPIQLGNGGTAAQACTNFNNGITETYYIDTLPFNTATMLATDSSLLIKVNSGWYSDGVVARLLSSSQFISTDLCQF